ncbi:MAG: FtsX-like permease family protein [Patescibacteria group bacterium]|jgi:ABC-type antimicrobial peptide transport system permease subunit
MRLSYILYLSFSNLGKRKLRSFLTIGGMAVGIALVVFLVSFGFGLQQLIRNQITNVEALTVLDVSKGESTLLKLNDETIDQFQQLNSVDKVSPSLSLSGQIAQNEAVTDAAIYGIEPSFLSIEGVKVSSGEEFSGSEAQEIIITATAVGLIGFENSTDAIGRDLTLKVLVPSVIEGTQEEDLISKEVPVKVRGIIEDTDDLSIIYTPIKFLETLGFKPDYQQAKVKVGAVDDKEYNLAKIKVEDESKLPEVRKQIEAMGYQVDSIADTVGQIDKIFLIFQAIVGAFGAIAMFVAAMGALNTLTVSLLERTREIGLMKSLGSTSGDIYRLFLTEAVLIGLTGGLVGIGLGIGLAELVNAALVFLAKRVGGEPVDIFYYPLIFLAAVVFIVFMVSVVTGIYPARRAAKINPLDALRYE